MTSPEQPRVVLRPLATPLPLGFLGLFVATTAFSTLQLGWIDKQQGPTVALCVLVLTVPVQLVAAVVGFLSRDPVAATGMGLLAGTWAAASLSTRSASPGAASDGLGVVLLLAGTAMLVPALAGRAKVVAATVMGLSALRFMVTGVAELTGTSTWMTAAGATGLLLALISLYAALAFELEGTQHRDVLPLWRRGPARAAVESGSVDANEVAREPGVREQL